MEGVLVYWLWPFSFTPHQGFGEALAFFFYGVQFSLCFAFSSRGLIPLYQFEVKKQDCNFCFAWLVLLNIIYGWYFHKRKPFDLIILDLCKCWWYKLDTLWKASKWMHGLQKEMNGRASVASCDPLKYFSLLHQNWHSVYCFLLFNFFSKDKLAIILET